MTKKAADDVTKKIFGKSAKEIFATPLPGHSEFHSPDAFCGNAGPEEMKHFQGLLDELKDDEIVTLVEAVGMHFAPPTHMIDRAELEGVLDEAAREDFYREYAKILASRG